MPDARTARSETISPTLGAALVFVASGVVLVLEILAVRLLAPYVGLTIETTTAIIGAALAGIAAGAAVGGWLADRTDARKLLAWLLLAGGLLSLLIVPLIRSLGPQVSAGDDVLVVAITLLTLVPPAAVLSAVTPTVARLRLHDLRSTGSIVGRLSAWATAGALVGTFATGFVLVPIVPVTTAILGIGIGLVALGAVLAIVHARLGEGTSALIVVLALGLGVFVATVDSPCDRETDYHCLRITEDPFLPSGRTLVMDDVRHSYVDLDDPTYLDFMYTNWIAGGIDDAHRAGQPVDAVFIGGGGFTLPRWLQATRQGSTAHVLEIDGDLVEEARSRLGLKDAEGLTVTVGDARMTMRRQSTDSADVVVGDAFGTYAVPWHLATTEWTEEVRRVLRPDGIYALNVIDFPPLDLLRAEVATLLAVFDEVRLVALPEEYELPPDENSVPGGGNAVLFASDSPLPDRAGAGDWGEMVLEGAALERFVAGVDPLRDDFAPADQHLTLPEA